MNLGIVQVCPHMGPAPAAVDACLIASLLSHPLKSVEEAYFAGIIETRTPED